MDYHKTWYNVVLIETICIYPRLFRLPINLNFLFSHSWPVVVYTFVSYFLILDQW